MRKSMTFSRTMQKASFFNKIDRKIHKIYLVLAILIGVSLSIFMPLFNEPDGQYHYTVATNMVGLSNDISAYGEESISTGMTPQIIVYQSGNYFEKYFKNKIVKMPMKNLPRTQVQQLPSKGSYDFWGHIIPAAGVWIGYHIYPSIGVMIVTARLLSTFVFSLSLFFIIRFIKRGKLFLLIISLCPVITNSIASLSYDALTYVIAAATFLIVVNTLIANKIRINTIIQMLIGSVFLYFGAKTNVKLLIVLFPMVLFVIFFNKQIEKVTVWCCDLFKRKWVSVISIFLTLLVVIGMIFLVYIKYPNQLFSLYRFVLNFSINMNPLPNTQQIFTGLLVVPNGRYNNMPLWISGIWYILLVLVILSEEKITDSRLFSWGSLILFFVGVAGVYYSYLPYYVPSSLSSLDSLGRIGGLQGRYFTPTLLLLPLFGGNTRFKTKITSENSIWIFSVVVIVISNALLLFGTLFGMMYNVHY